jgi:fibronectin-binding autotransporter adhesin
MADRYWVGGTGNWNDTAKWSTTSGGSGGASIPVAGDNAIFDQAGPYTVSMNATWAVNNFIVTGTSITFSWSLLNGTISGSFDCVAGTVHTGSANTHTFTATTTDNIIRNKNLSANIFTGTGSWTLQSDLLFSNNTTTNALSNGTLNCNGFAIQGSGLSQFTVNSGTINFGTANHFIGGQSGFGGGLNINGGTVNFESSIVRAMNWSITGGTINAGTATLRVLLGGTFTSIQRTYPTIDLGQTGGTLTGPMTITNLTAAAPSAAGVTTVNIGSRLTIDGTLSTFGTAGNRRVWFRGVTAGIAQTLTVNASPSLTDTDFRDLYVVGTAAPISGTRMGNRGACSGITSSAAKTVYWVTVAGGNWSGNNWGATSGGAASADNFPLAQDTAVIENTGLNISATVTLDTAIPYVGTITMATRTNAMTLSLAAGYIVYGNWVNGSGTALSGAQTLTFSGPSTQTITSAGKTFPGDITVDSYGGPVELADALNIGSRTFFFSNGTFDTKGYNLTSGRFNTNYSSVRTLKLNASTITLANAVSGNVWEAGLNLVLQAGTSTIQIGEPGVTFVGGGYTYYNVSFYATQFGSRGITGSNTFNNLSLINNQAGFTTLALPANQTVNGTLSVTGSLVNRRFFLSSDTVGTPRTLTVGTLVANFCDFRNIVIQGAATGTAISNCGDAGGNAGITFPSPKTVYWNLAGTQNWEATAWASSSGGAPAASNFPLAQDTAIFDNAGSAGTVTIGGYFVGTVDMSARTSAMTLTSGAPTILGDWKWGTGVTSTSNANALTFAKRGTQTITSNGVTFGCPVTINSLNGTVQLADALSSTSYIQLVSGIFDAAIYNVTITLLDSNNSNIRTLKMGSGTWTLTSPSTVWYIAGGNLTFLKGTANIVISDATTGTKNFGGGSLSYNKLTIGGSTGNGIVAISGANQFTEIASTKTVAHTISMSGIQTFGKWSVTGTAGNVVTIGGVATNHVLAGSATSGIDYLAMGSVGFSATSPGEFYAGANSTGTAGAPVYRTATPSSRTLYWVGGTGNWSGGGKWSLTSGGTGGEPDPTSLDDVIFNSASNSASYTVTLNSSARCNKLTISGPASGSMTLAGSSALIAHDNVTFPATGLITSFSGGLVLSGSTSGKVLITNGNSIGGSNGSLPLQVNGYNARWTLGSALSISGNTGCGVFIGALDCAIYGISSLCLYSNYTTPREIKLGSGTHVFVNQNLGINFDNFSSVALGTTEASANSLIFDGGTSTIVLNPSVGTVSDRRTVRFYGNGKTFYNVVTTNRFCSYVIHGRNTFNDFEHTTFNGAGSKPVYFEDNQTINGVLKVTSSSNALNRGLVMSYTFGKPVTLTCNSAQLVDADFRDIAINGLAAPISGIRIGDMGGNSGITFTPIVYKYWNLAGGGSVFSTAWATSSGGTPDLNNFPLPQDICVFENTGLNANASVTLSPNNTPGQLGSFLGTIDASSRTIPMTLTTGVQTSPVIYGDWKMGSGVTTAGSSGFSLEGRKTQYISTVGIIQNYGIDINSPNGTVILQDAISLTGTLSLTNGAFNSSDYNVTAAAFSSSNSNLRSVNVGSSTWTLSGTTPWGTATISGFSINGNAILRLNSASAKTFAGGGASYSGITLDQAGAGTLTITGNNTFGNITNTYKSTGATTIALGNTIQRVATFTASGEVGRLLTITGTSASSPATIVYTGNSNVSSNYLNIVGIRAFPTVDTWNAGSNSVNNGSLGWIFNVPTVTYSNSMLLMFL